MIHFRCILDPARIFIPVARLVCRWARPRRVAMGTLQRAPETNAINPGGVPALPVILTLLSLLAVSVFAGDWPTYRHDNHRSGVSLEALTLPLAVKWEYTPPAPPHTAWTGPAKWDAFSGNAGLQSMRNFDPVFYTTVASNTVYFGSSVDHAAHALDLQTGKARWVAFADAAVRLPPTIANGMALFGSDDGFVRCVDATSGILLWHYRAQPNPRLIVNNGLFISPWPVRTGVLIDGDRALFGASLFPWKASYLCAVELDSGREIFKKSSANQTLQGAMLATPDTLYSPQGRSPPLVFDLKTGAARGVVKGSGGVFCLLTDAGELVAGPSSQKPADPVVRIAGDSRESLLSFSGADRILVAREKAWLHQFGALKAVDLDQLRQQQAAGNKNPSATLWEQASPLPYDIILAGHQLITGMENRIDILDANSGQRLWSTAVTGRVMGLTAAGGRLIASLDTGAIRCFGP